MSIFNNYVQYGHSVQKKKHSVALTFPRHILRIAQIIIKPVGAKHKADTGSV